MQREVNSFSDGDHNVSVLPSKHVNASDGSVDSKCDHDDALEQYVGWLQVPVNTFVECVVVLDNHVDVLCNHVGWLQRSVDELDKHVGWLQRSVDELDKHVGWLQRSVDERSGCVDT